TRARASERLRRLASSERAAATRLDGDRVAEVPIDQLIAGDRLRVMPGEAVPADGVLETDAELDESLITGESHPVLCKPGDRVIAGSLNLAQEPLVLCAEAVGGQTRVAQMRRLLLRAALRKPPVQLLSDRIAGHFTLTILVLAAIGGLAALPRGADAALNVVLSVLVASCPCALSLAVPAVLAAATSRLAGRGVLVAHAGSLLRMADVDVVLLDKTGTVTESKLVVQRCETSPSRDVRDVTRIVAALESGLAHPVARAFAGEGDGTLATSVRVKVGRGVSGLVHGKLFEVGPAEGAIAALDPALSWITLSDEHRDTVAHFGLGVALRADARSTLEGMVADGLRVELLTGDSPEAAHRTAALAGIATVASRQSAEDKLKRLRALQQEGHVVLAVGDGHNDAAFLAAADVSAAMPAGAAVTQARADLILVNERLDGLRMAREAGRQARRRVRENLAWAGLYNLAVLPLAFAGELQPWIAAAGMSLSSLLVVANALRFRLPENS
ncbi:MAG: heavy metal translocating P-type ATPase, partial [Panacagrimonas sp.]